MDVPSVCTVNYLFDNPVLPKSGLLKTTQPALTASSAPTRLAICKNSGWYHDFSATAQPHLTIELIPRDSLRGL